MAAVEAARTQILTNAGDIAASAADVDRRLSQITGEIDRLTSALAQGAALESIVTAVKAREQERDQLGVNGTLRGLRAAKPVANDVDALKVDIERWRELLRKHTPQARQVVKKVLRTRVVLKPETRNEVDGVAFWAEGSLQAVIEASSTLYIWWRPRRDSQRSDLSRIAAG